MEFSLRNLSVLFVSAVSSFNSFTPSEAWLTPFSLNQFD